MGGAFGWGGAAGTVSWTAPSEELPVVYMVQQPTDLPGQIAEVVRDALQD
jgi:CubicO group peptidase (beta-lactamase class C family)